MRYQRALGGGVAGPNLFTAMAAVLDPLVTGHGGQPAEVITPMLAQAWRQAFATELPEPVLTRCARAVAERTPWTEELFPDGWYRPGPARSPRRSPAPDPSPHLPPLRRP